MKSLVLLFAITAVASGLEWTSFYAKWNTWLLDPFRANSFFTIPRTQDEVENEGWTEVSDLNALGLTTYCYPDDGQFCVLLDSYGYIAGFQVGILASDFDSCDSQYSAADFSMYQTKTIFTEVYDTITIYTQNPSCLPTGKSSDWDGTTGTEGLWFENSDGSYQEVPRNVSNWDSKWIKEACISAMGTHYYWDMSNTTDCADFLPIFLLAQDNELSGIGVQAFGSCSIKSRCWCEWVPAAAIKPTIPTTPQCLIDWAGDYGVISMHYYFTPKPWKISC